MTSKRPLRTRIERVLARRRLRRALRSERIRYLEAHVETVDGVDAALIRDLNSTEESSS